MVLHDVVRDTIGDFHVCLAQEVNDYLAGKRGEPETHDTDGLCGCSKGEAFLEKHVHGLVSLHQKFMSLRKDLRLELADWLLKRSQTDHYFTDTRFKPLMTQYHNSLHFAHLEYGQMHYPRKAGLCEHCGVD